MSSSDGNNICENCTTDQDGRVYIHTMCQTCRDKHDEDLFQQPPQELEECPICFLTIPSLMTGSKYKSCCGKMICSGCIHAVEMMDGEAKCPFCRVPTPESDEEVIGMIMKRVEMDDAKAIFNYGCYYYDGLCGLPQNYEKAFELWHRAGELGCASAYYSIGHAYYCGRGVERDEKKAQHFWETAAVGGNESARYILGCFEDGRNMSRALRHYMIASGCGGNESLKKIREFYVNGHATKDDYAKALRAHQKYIIDGIKSAQRDDAALFDNGMYRYF